MSVSQEAQGDVACVVGPNFPCYRTCHAPRPVNPSIHRHRWEPRRAFVLSNWLVGAGICESRSLYRSRMCIFDRIQNPTSQACRQTILYRNHCQSHRGCRLDLALVDDLGLQFFTMYTMYLLLIELMIGLVLFSHALHSPCRPCQLSPTDTIFLSRAPN
ncbi:hypothetical protein EDB89DRAFT_1941035 [Lactarius sanguifluus]|nr:hypothetical protein EDB89DRAFT_1941035 [Lactarius sanguifluus]